MGKNQITTKNTTQSQGFCEKIFKAMNISPAFRSFRRISPQSPKFATTTNSASKPKIDHQRNYTAKATASKPVALHQPHAQNGSTFPLELNRQQSNMVYVEYNHSSGESVIPKFKAESLKPVNKSHQQNQYDKGTKAEPHVNQSPGKHMFTIVHHQINECPRDDSVSNDRFSNYIDHVKNKMRNMSSFDDDKVGHYIDRSKFKIY
ncbi:hypothetical protein K7X08_032779 [Anisodus acutangulus]|uniref:Uncharacterized protein n=1 Tax=Anisodus acutangulus TaxID=402998 RepID=A0A9Q1M233_9SOLA|nr:hypothetical protein K7X08_032779 [Anisodus acutangulus]